MRKNPKTLCVFLDNNAKILKNPEKFEEMLSWPNVVPDPDLTKVIGHPPHFWKFHDGEVVPLEGDERIERLKHISDHGADNTIRRIGPDAVIKENQPAPELTLEQEKDRLDINALIIAIFAVIATVAAIYLVVSGGK